MDMLPEHLDPEIKDQLNEDDAQVLVGEAQVEES